MPFDVKAGFSWAKSHPWETGGIVFIAGAVFLLLFHGGKGGSSGSGSGNLAAYLQAETAQNAQDNAFALGKVQADAATAQAHVAADRDLSLNTLWAQNSLATTTSNNEATQQKSLIDYFGQIANNLGQVLTNSSSKSSGGSGGLNLGFNGFGFGFNSSNNQSSSSSSQTLVANQNQLSAEQELELIANSVFHAGH